MATESLLAAPPSLQGIGNTINTIHVSPQQSPPITTSINPTFSVHSVQPTSTAVSAPHSNCSDEKKDDLLHAQVHNSARTFTGEKHSADGANSRARERELAGANEKERPRDDAMGDVGMQPQHAPSQNKSAKRFSLGVDFAAEDEDEDDDIGPTSSISPASAPLLQRVYTFPHPIESTRSRFPPLPDRSPADASASPETGRKECIFDVDLRSLGRGYSLFSTNSNNLVMLKKMMHKYASMQHEKDRARLPISFSPRDLMQGLNLRNIKVRRLDTKRNTATATAVLAAAAAPSSSVVQTPSHRFTLSFDSSANCAHGMSLLRRLGLSPFPPTELMITGKVHGIHYTTDNNDITQHMQKHAWYVGAATSLVITRIEHIMEDDMYYDVCYFAVLASEAKYLQQIPMLRNPNQYLRWERYHSSRKRICGHCHKEGHNSKACPHAQQTNKEHGIRDACLMCASFEHAIMSCPDAKREEAQCMLCHDGKHIIRACPLYRGSYSKMFDHGVGSQRTNPHASIWKRPPHVQMPSSAVNVYAPNASSNNTTHTTDTRTRQEMSEMRSMIKQLQASLASKDKKFEEMMTTMRDMMTSQTAMMNTITQLTAQISANTHANNGVHVGHAPLQAMTATPSTPSSSAFSVPKPRSRISSVDASQPSMNAFIQVGRQSQTQTTTTVTASTTTPATPDSISNENAFNALCMDDDDDDEKKQQVSAETTAIPLPTTRKRTHSTPTQLPEERPRKGSVPSSARSLITALTTPNNTSTTTPRSTTKRVRANNKA